MAVKKGYKQTEVGVIPEDWEVIKLGSVIHLQGGFSFKSEDFTEFGVPVIRISDIQNGVVVTDNAICHPAIKIASEFVINPGDTLVAMSGATTGKVGVYESDSTSYQNQRVGRFVIQNKNSTSFRFVRHLVGSATFGSQLSSLLEQGAQPNISGYQIESLSFSFPPTLAEQEAIAGALSDADAWIESLEQLIVKKRQIKQGAMQELLTGKRRLPGFSQSWCKRALSELLKYHRLGGNYPNNGAETNYPLMKMGNVDRGKFNTNKIEYVSNNITPDQQDRLKRGDILLNTRNTLDLVGKVAIWRDELPLAYYNSNLLRLHFDPAIVGSHFFMNFALNSEDVIRQLRERATGTTSVAAIYTRDLLNVEVQLPTNCDEQIAIAEVIEDMNAEIESLESKLAKAREIKQGMMQELLTGRIRFAPIREEQPNV